MKTGRPKTDLRNVKKGRKLRFFDVSFSNFDNYL